MITSRMFARLFATITLGALAAACAAGQGETEPETIDGPDESVSIDPDGTSIRLFRAGGSTGGTTSTAKCYSLTCPGTKQDDCLLPCIRAGATSTRCAKECGCTMTERECAPKFAM